jgi:Holliday junction DNA helicase RuvA
MIITLTGIVANKAEGAAIVEVGGVGYHVHMNAPTLSRLQAGTAAKLWTHEYIREDARELYGFASSAEHRMFRTLLAISGVGPKTAMNLLTLGTVAEIEALIEKADVTRLTSVSGVGKKTAQKIVLELKGKLVGDDAGQGDDVVTALVGLGYSREKARDAVAAVAQKETSDEGRLRAALKQLGR